MTDNETQSPYMDEYRRMPATGSVSSPSSFPVGSTYSWYGPVCTVCGRGYMGQHKCSITDLQRKIDDLQRVIDSLKTPTQINRGFDPSTCPCSPTRGGSGICGCTLGGPTITC